MYKTLDECQKNASERIAKAIRDVRLDFEYAKDGDQSGSGRFEDSYANDQLQKDYNTLALYAAEKENWGKCAEAADENCRANGFESPINDVTLVHMPDEYDTKDADIVSNVMHIINSDVEKETGRNMHEQSIKDLAGFRDEIHDNYGKEYQCENSAIYADSYMSAAEAASKEVSESGEVPKAADEVIHRFFTGYENVAVDTRQSYYFEHRSIGNDYDVEHYEPDTALVTVYAADPEYARQAIEGFEQYKQSGEYEKDVRAEQQREAAKELFSEHEEIVDDSNMPEYEETHTETRSEEDPACDFDEMQQEQDGETQDEDDYTL